MNNNHIAKTARALLEERKEHDRTSQTPSPLRSQIRIPTQRPAAQTPSRKQRATQHVTKEWTTEAAHADQISSHFSPERKTAESLESRQIQPFSLKKTKKVLQKMRELERVDLKAGKKTSILKPTSSEQKKQNDQDALWRDLMKPQEERHFRIGRIANFFS